MYAVYHAAREALGPDAPEEEILYHVLKTRPPFSNFPEDCLREIVEECPDIDSLIAFVIGFDKNKQSTIQ
jgi:hypothetical protein